MVDGVLGPTTSRGTVATPLKRRLVDRVKLLLASDLHRRWTLVEIAAAIGGSGVCLTQAFQQVEGLPLYRHQLRLRLAGALDLIARCTDMSALALEFGFSSHSHFAAAFRQTYGMLVHGLSRIVGLGGRQACPIEPHTAPPITCLRRPWRHHAKDFDSARAIALAQ